MHILLTGSMPYEIHHSPLHMTIQPLNLIHSIVHYSINFMLRCIKNLLQLHDFRYFVFSLRNEFLVCSYIEICRQEVFGLSLSTLSSCSFKGKCKTRIRICILYHLRGWYFDYKFWNSFIYTYRFIVDLFFPIW